MNRHLSVKSILSVLSAGALLLGICPVSAQNAEVRQEIAAAVSNGSDYREYSLTAAGAALSDQSFTANLGELYLDGAAFDGEKISFPFGASIEWKLESVPEARYEIELKYAAREGTSGNLDYSLKLDGEYPFEECRSLTLFRNYELPNGKFKKDTFGNELPYEPEERFECTTVCVSDKSGKQQSPFLFRLSSGERLSFTNNGCEIYIYGIALVPNEKSVSYKDYRKQNDDTEMGEYSQITEGEDAISVNTPRIGVSCDSSTAAVSPAAWENDVMNYIGGEGWSTPGAAVTWQFSVHKTGYYKISFRARQDYTGGLFVSRRLFIDGKIPFEEANALEFPFAMGWQVTTVGDKNGDYEFYLTEGRHTLSLECVIGSMGEYVSEIETALDELNGVYRRVLMLTGTSPDTMRDYSIEEKMPEIKAPLKEAYDILDKVSRSLKSISGQNGTDNVVFKDLLYQLKTFISDMETIPSKMSSFQSNLSAMATWINSRYEQPLDIDCFEVHTGAPKKISTDLFTAFKFFCVRFLRTFSDGYTSADLGSKNTEIEVWIPTARARSEVIKTLINDKFIPQNNIDVNIKLMTGAELNAIVAGLAPDVLVEQDAGAPVNYAMRRAVADLTQFSDFEEASKRFAEATFIPFRYNGGCYALPETMTIPMLFYRTDIFELLNIDPPNTWDDVYSIIAVLSANNMQFGGVSFDMLLYQLGGSYYNADGVSSALGTDAAVKAFKMWTEFYSDYGLPLSYNFLNRFRSGEMPVSIADYTLANQLDVMAPEISGDWSVAPIPAMNTEAGLNRTAVTASTACYIIQASRHKPEAWEFLKWWTDADTQYQYSTRLENKLGSVARIGVSNLKALESIPWSANIRSSVNAQLPHLTAVEQVPGGYFTSRHINNAFRHVVYYNENVRETLNEYINTINEEIAERRREFGLSVK